MAAEESLSVPKGKGMRLFRCEVCSVKFQRKGHLTVHMRIHAPNKRYPCALCEAKFTQKGSYLAHMEMHTEPRGYFCTICEKRYAHRSSLDTHMRSHANNSQFVCPICSSHFNYKDLLDLHMKTHPERKTVYSQSLLSTATSSGSTFTGHTISSSSHNSYLHSAAMSPSPRIPAAIFMDERIMPCDICGSRFTNERALQAHKRFHKRGPGGKQRKRQGVTQYHMSGRHNGGSARTEPHSIMMGDDDEDDEEEDELEEEIELEMMEQLTEDDSVDVLSMVGEDVEDELVREMNEVGALHLTL